MLGDTRRSRVGILVVTVSASVVATGVIVASCLERGLMHQARENAALSSLRSSEDDTSVAAGVTTGTTTTSAAELEALAAANAAATHEATATSEAPTDTGARQEAPPAPSPSMSSPAEATSNDAHAIADTLDRTVTTLERIDEAQRRSEAEAEDADREAREAVDADERARAAREPSADERRRTAQLVAGTPMLQPRFEDVGAGAFLTEAPLWGASAMTSDPSAGAGPFTTETIMSPNIVYFGVPQSAGVVPSGVGVVPQGAAVTPSPGAIVVQPAP